MEGFMTQINQLEKKSTQVLGPISPISMNYEHNSNDHFKSTLTLNHKTNRFEDLVPNKNTVKTP